MSNNRIVPINHITRLACGLLTVFTMYLHEIVLTQTLGNRQDIVRKTVSYLSAIDSSNTNKADTSKSRAVVKTKRLKVKI